MEGTPSPEVTGSFCRVPKRGFSLAPEDILLAYLCRFAVRSPAGSLEAFLGSMGWATLLTEVIVIRSRKRASVDLPAETSYTLEPPRPIGGWLTLLRHPIGLDRQPAVREC